MYTNSYFHPRNIKVTMKKMVITKGGNIYEETNEIRMESQKKSDIVTTNRGISDNRNKSEYDVTIHLCSTGESKGKQKNRKKSNSCKGIDR